MTEQRHAAYLAAYELFEAVQTERHAAAVAELRDAEAVAAREHWPEVELILAGVRVVHSLTRSAPGLAAAGADALVSRSEALGSPALMALALALRAVTASMTGDTAALMADAGRAVALLDDETEPAVDRCTAYVVAAAAFNTLRVWELVDELYTRAAELEVDCEVPVQAAAIAVNRILTRLEWALTLLELGEEAQAQDRLGEAADAVGDAMACHNLPRLWQRDVEACALIVHLLRGRPSSAVGRGIETIRDALTAGNDVEVLPLLDAAVSLALWRCGDGHGAAAAIGTMTPVGSASSGSRSFPLWVRAQILAGTRPTAAVLAALEHGELVSRLHWQSRRAVLAASRAQIAAERHKGEHERLSHAVNTDPLTGLSNRRPFDAWLRAASTAPPLPTALLLADVDDFKAINDTHGHDVGDQVLRRFGELLLACVRPGDLAVRHGGDEFAALLQGEQLTGATAAARAEQFRTAVAAEPWSSIAPGLDVRASIGMAVSVPAGEPATPAGHDPAELYRAADAALYAAKRSGCGLHVTTVGPENADTDRDEVVLSARS